MIPESTSLLQTKLYIPPLRSNLLLRDRLLSALETAQDGKITLISAPAGFGKTTLLSGWFHQKLESGQLASIGWLTLDEGDNNELRFWRHTVAALQKVDPEIGQTVESALRSAQNIEGDAISTALINDIAESQHPVILVLDDYHLIEENSIHRGINTLLDFAPPNFHLIITTRADPPLNLSRRRARRELTELRTANLCFTDDEIREFVNTVMKLKLPPEDIIALQNRTEGWIAGLQMAALSLQGMDPERQHAFIMDFAGDDRYIVDYLLEEVFQRQTDEIQDFLLGTSILGRLNSSLCDSVTGKKNGQQMLDELEQANLFIIPLDNRRRWYRYHRLFSDLLRQRLKETTTKTEIDGLHLKASTWFETNGYIIEAVDQVLEVSDPECAAKRIERHVLRMFYRSETVQVNDWLQSLPQDVLRAHPLLCAVYANVLMLLQPEDLTNHAEKWLGYAERSLELQVPQENDQTERSFLNMVTCFISTFRAYLARFQAKPAQQVLELTLKALQSLPEDDDSPFREYYLNFRSALNFNLGLVYAHLQDFNAAEIALGRARKNGIMSGDMLNVSASAYIQADIACKKGQLHEAAAICEGALQSIRESMGKGKAEIPYSGSILIVLGEVLLQWNRQKEAEQVLSKGLELMNLTSTFAVQRRGCLALANLKLSQGDGDAVHQLLEKAGQDPYLNRSSIQAFKLTLWSRLAEQDRRHLDKALRFLDENQLELNIEASFAPEQLSIIRVLMLQSRGKIIAPSRRQQLETFFENQRKQAEQAGWIEWLIQILILQALFWHQLKDKKQAHIALEEALRLAEPGGYIRIFVDEGELMRQLIEQCYEQDRSSAYIENLLAVFNQKKTASQSPDVLVEALSTRELEVLRLIAKGYSNPEIAEKFVISVHTVKKHVTNIFGKLGVTSRTQAVARARELQLVE